MLRTCKYCGLIAVVEADLEKFAISKPSKYGRENCCKVCSNKEQREKYNQAEYIRQYRIKNRDILLPKQQVQGSLYRKNNRAKYNAIEAKRRAAKLNSISTVSIKEQKCIEVLYKTARILSKLSMNTYHVDHITPLSVGGGHVLGNLQIVPAKFNLKKGNRNNDKYIPINSKFIRKFCLQAKEKIIKNRLR